jgi:hypothetical protein
VSSRSKPFVTHDGSTLVTNASIVETTRCHQLDHTFRCPELRSVDSTAASWHQDDPAAVGATDCTNLIAKLASVAMPGAPSEIVVYHFDRAPKADLLTA